MKWHDNDDDDYETSSISRRRRQPFLAEATPVVTEQRFRIAPTHPSAARSMNDDIERSRSRQCAARVLAIRAPLAHRHARRTAVVKQASVLKSSTAKLLLSRRSAVRVAAIRAAKLGCHDACARQSIHVRNMHSICRRINQLIRTKSIVTHAYEYERKRLFTCHR